MLKKFGERDRVRTQRTNTRASRCSSFPFNFKSRSKQAPHSQMCKHVLNAQVAIRAPCCKRWFDCSECHKEITDHDLQKTDEMVFACKKCKKVFRKNMREYEESDEFCPGCDNHYVIDAKTPENQGALMIGFEGTMDMIRDERTKAKSQPQD